jgi:hypothetical protein
MRRMSIAFRRNPNRISGRTRLRSPGGVRYRRGAVVAEERRIVIRAAQYGRMSRLIGYP